MQYRKDCSAQRIWRAHAVSHVSPLFALVRCVLSEMLSTQAAHGLVAVPASCHNKWHAWKVHGCQERPRCAAGVLAAGVQGWSAVAAEQQQLSRVAVAPDWLHAAVTGPVLVMTLVPSHLT